MNNRRLRKRDELAVHFRCDICGKIQPVEFITPDDMLMIITDYINMAGKHVCGACESKIGAIIESVEASEWGRNNGLHD